MMSHAQVNNEDIQERLRNASLKKIKYIKL